jgi:uncharacterized protein
LPILSSTRRFRRLAVSALALAAVWAASSALVHAQTTGGEPANTALTPFPESDVYKLQVYGDGFAEGLSAGIADVLGNTPRVQVQKKHKSIGALVRSDWEDDIKLEEASKEVVHIGVLMFGLSDRQIIRPAQGSKSLAIGSDEWREEYGRRIDRVLKGLKKRGMVVYMVGQPVLRNSGANTQAELINEIMRQRATANGVKFIGIFDQFQDEGGGFTQFGPDVTGNRVKLRDGDGVTFTSIGYKQLAFFVEKELRRDIEQAAVDRTVPLAGDESEQRRVNPGKQATAGSGAPAWKGSVTIGGQTKSAVQPQVPVAPTAVDTSGDQKSDNGRVTVKMIASNGREETATIEILRPAIPAAVIALVTRREFGADKTAQPGEAVVEEIGGGLTVVNSVSVLGDGTASAGRRKLSPTQSAFYTVLIKGERPTARIGRADDFAWPRQDAVVAPEPAPPAEGPRAVPGPGQPNVRLGPAAAPSVRTAPSPPPPKSGQKG